MNRSKPLSRTRRSVAPWAVALAFLAALPAMAERPEPILEVLRLPVDPGAEASSPGASDAPGPGDLPHPSDFLGYALGERFTPQARQLDYFEALAAASDRVRLETYGTTHQGRPLSLVVIASPQHLDKLEDLRRASLRLVAPGLRGDELESLVDGLPAVVWLAFGVHGNETSPAETAMAVAYTLAASSSGGGLGFDLDDVVVILDPLANPDGHGRYVSWFRSQRSRLPDPHPDALGHHEPWPGGRFNHYLVDLNRDWAWLTQVETRQRLAAYRRWEPQVYVDFHEMSSTKTYFFPPAADPVHPGVPPSTLAWLETFGRSNADAFDRRAWLYFVREEYDLFYPGYGDTYPILRGGIGMTYEMAGGGRAGSLLELADGRRLTLVDRVSRHYVTALATLRTAAEGRRRLLRAHVARQRELADSEPIRYLWRPDQPEAAAMAELLTAHGIDVRRLTRSTQLQVTPLVSEDPGLGVARTLPAGTWVASTGQRLGTLLRVLVEPSPEIPEPFLERQRDRLEAGEDPEIYDVTAWSLPLAFNVETWRTLAVPPTTAAPWPAADASPADGSTPVGWFVHPQGLAGYRLAASLGREGVRFRWALDALGEEPDSRGGLFVPRQGNRLDTGERLGAAADSTGASTTAVGSSWSLSGTSLGSASLVPVRVPRVALVAGKGVRQTSHGDLWHLLDVDIGLPVTRLSAARLGAADLGDFDVLIFPDGDWGEALGGDGTEAVGRWLRSGGLLVTVAGASEWLIDRGWTGLRKLDGPDAGEGAAEGRGGGTIDVPGAIVATDLARRHPLTAGVRLPPPVLVRGDFLMRPTGDPKVDLLSVRDDRSVLGGLVWPDAEARLPGALLMATEDVGDGRVVAFAQDPAFRLFWRGTMPLFLNAVMFGPSL
ncbi:MAG: M14 family zinc carboxypeptidase [Acidobacteriota bacterium]